MHPLLKGHLLLLLLLLPETREPIRVGSIQRWARPWAQHEKSSETVFTSGTSVSAAEDLWSAAEVAPKQPQQPELPNLI